MLKIPPPVKLFMSLIHNNQENVEKCIEILNKRIGEINFRSDELKFDDTTYYDEEMGHNLVRIIISFEKLIPRDELVDIKIFTTELEIKFSFDHSRTVNIDPGYISAEHLILATGKGYYHRPYLGRGVYADLTLVYQNNNYRGFEWTYPDYNSDQLKNIFLKLRSEYLKQLKNRKK